MTASRVALQCHGAIGYTTEYDLHLYMKRAWALARAWGDAGWHRRRIEQTILGGSNG
jgi:alkylation response protein AidB-like acyl-CoA dehydrogenase